MIERNAHGVEEPMPTWPFEFTRKSEVVADSFTLVEEAISNSGIGAP